MAIVPVTISLRPGLQWHPNRSCSRGLRMSASSSRTRFPVSAKAIAILYATVDLPSPKRGLVTTKEGRRPEREATEMAVRSARKDSAAVDFGSSIKGLDPAFDVVMGEFAWRSRNSFEEGMLPSIGS